MKERIIKEIELLRSHFPEIEYRESGWWIRLPGYRLPDGWNTVVMDIVFQFPQSGYPQNPFYGFYVPSGLRYGETFVKPENFTDPATAQPPFEGKWAFFSGNPKPWAPNTEVSSGSNALSWVHSIGQRLREGLGAEE